MLYNKTGSYIFSLVPAHTEVMVFSEVFLLFWIIPVYIILGRQLHCFFLIPVPCGLYPTEIIKFVQFLKKFHFHTTFYTYM